jgi:hypothetical protein
VVIFEIGCNKLFAWLASNCDPPDFSSSSSYDYRCEPPAPGGKILLSFLKTVETLATYALT